MKVSFAMVLLGSGLAGVLCAQTGKILAVDAKNHPVTLQDPDGKDKTIKVSKKVQNLDQLKAGDMIGVELTEAMAIEVVK